MEKTDFDTKRIWKTGCLLLLSLLFSSCSGAGQSTGYRTREQSRIYADYLISQYAGHRENLKTHAKYIARTLEDFPDNLEIIKASCKPLMLAGYKAKALQCFQALLKQDPKDRFANLALATEAFRKGKYSFHDFARKDSDITNRDIEVDLFRIWSLVEKKKLQEALDIVAVYEKKEDIISTLFEIQKAFIYEEAGQFKKAENIFANLNLFNKRRSLLLYGEYLVRRGKKAKALKLYQDNLTELKALDLEIVKKEIQSLKAELAQNPSGQKNAKKRRGPKSRLKVKIRSEHLAQAFEGLGTLYFQHEVLEASLLFYRLALWLDPMREEAKALTATIFESRGFNKAALELFESIPSSSPYYPLVQIQSFALLKKLNRQQESFRQLKEAVEKTGNPKLRYTLAEEYTGQKNYKDAEQILSELIEETRGKKEEWKYYFSRGAARERMKQWEKGEADLKKALLLSPDNPIILNYLGYSWIDQNVNYKQAFAYIQKAAELAPTGYILDSLGWAYYRTLQYEKAIENLERATELQPEESEINDHLGDAYWRVGRHREAQYQWEKALRQYKDGEQKEKDRIKRKIEKGLPDEKAQDKGSFK